MPYTTRTFTLPLSPADRETVRQLVESGFHQRVQGNVVVLRRRGDDAPSPQAATFAFDAAFDELATLVGPKPAGVLLKEGYGSVEAAREAIAQDRAAVAALKGIGPKTLASLDESVTDDSA